MPGLYDIDFLRNVVLTNVVQNAPLQGNLRGGELLPDMMVPTKKVEWERVYGGRNIAPVVAQNAPSPFVKAAGMDRLSAEALNIRERFVLDEDTLLFLRQPGERESRSGRNIVNRQLAQMRGDVMSRKEKMIWDAVISGSISETQTVDNTSLVISVDFGVPATQRVDATDSGYGGAWTTPGTANPKLCFKQSKKTVREATGRTVKFAYMNSNTHDTLDAVSGLHTDWRAQESAPQDLVKSAHITDIIQNVRILDYDEGYKTDVNWQGTFQYFLPDNKVVYTVGASDNGEPYGDFAIAPSRLLDGSTVDGMYAEAWTSADEPVEDYIRVGMRGIPRIFHPDWVIVETVNA